MSMVLLCRRRRQWFYILALLSLLRRLIGKCIFVCNVRTYVDDCDCCYSFFVLSNVVHVFRFFFRSFPSVVMTSPRVPFLQARAFALLQEYDSLSLAIIVLVSSRVLFRHFPSICFRVSLFRSSTAFIFQVSAFVCQVQVAVSKSKPIRDLQAQVMMSKSTSRPTRSLRILIDMKLSLAFTPSI